MAAVAACIVLGIWRPKRTERPGSEVHDDEVPELRIVVGAALASYKLVGRINDGSDRYVSIIIGRTDELSLRTARAGRASCASR